jgi:hypothetical protein
MSNSTLYVLALILTTLPSRGAVTDGAVAAGMGGTGAVLTGFWSVLNNPAGLAGYRFLSIGVSAEQRFLLRETGSVSLAIAAPLGSNTLFASIRQYGNAAFRHYRAGLGLARFFGEKISVGIQLNYLSTHISQGYGRSGGVTFEAGMLVSLSDDFVLAAHAFNPMAIKHTSNEGETAESSFVLGAGYDLSEQLLLCMEVEKDIRYKPVFRFGLQYKPSPLAIVRFGYSSRPVPVKASGYSLSAVYTIGYGLIFKNINLDLSAMMHNVLGWSPVMSIFHEFRRFEP